MNIVRRISRRSLSAVNSGNKKSVKKFKVKYVDKSEADEASQVTADMISTTITIKHWYISCPISPATRHIAYNELTEILINQSDSKKYKERSFGLRFHFKAKEQRSTISNMETAYFVAKSKEQRDTILKEIFHRLRSSDANRTHLETIQSATAPQTLVLYHADQDDHDGAIMSKSPLSSKNDSDEDNRRLSQLSQNEAYDIIRRQSRILSGKLVTPQDLNPLRPQDSRSHESEVQKLKDIVSELELELQRERSERNVTTRKSLNLEQNHGLMEAQNENLKEENQRMKVELERVKREFRKTNAELEAVLDNAVGSFKNIAESLIHLS